MFSIFVKLRQIGEHVVVETQEETAAVALPVSAVTVGISPAALSVSALLPVINRLSFVT